MAVRSYFCDRPDRWGHPAERMSMNQLTRCVTAAVLVGLGISMGAAGAGQGATPEAAWLGTWRLDISKSDFSGDTVTYSKRAVGLYHVAAGGNSDYDFGIDGKDYPCAYGRTTAWTAVGARAWDSVTRMSGVILYKAHRELSADTKTLSLTVTGTNADGSLLNQTTVFTRVTGARGLVGTWRDTRTDAGAPAMFVISSPSPGVMRWDLPQWKQYVEGKPDGRSLRIQGEGNAPAGMTFSAKFEAPTKLTYVIKYNGKPDQYGVQTLAADGRSYTDVSWTPGREHEKGTGVYVKQ